MSPEKEPGHRLCPAFPITSVEPVQLPLWGACEGDENSMACLVLQNKDCVLMRLLSINTFGGGYTWEWERLLQDSICTGRKDGCWLVTGKCRSENGFQLVEGFLSDSLPTTAARDKTFTGKACSVYGRKNQMAVCNTRELGTVSGRGELICLGLQMPA